MENTGFVGLLKTLYQRVILSYRSTLIGIGVYALSILAEQLIATPNKVLSTIGLILGTVLTLVKDKVPAPPRTDSVTPAGT